MGGVDPSSGDRVTPTRGRAGRVRWGVGRAREPLKQSMRRFPAGAQGRWTPHAWAASPWERDGVVLARVPGRRVVGPDSLETDSALPPYVQCQLPRLPTTWAVGTDRPTALRSAVQCVVRCVEPDPDAEAVGARAAGGQRPPEGVEQLGRAGDPRSVLGEQLPAGGGQPAGRPYSTLTAPAAPKALTFSPERQPPSQRSRRG